ncbi:LamG domain-containing protein [Puteibacter caeruleilacunae]|nr:LamG domain-containing protein [Puteibacter caeruleilacunae]
MKTTIIQLFIVLSLALLFNNCDDSDDMAPEKIISNKGVQGVIQKGPFVSGAIVTVQELDSFYVATGRSLAATTNNDYGEFMVEGDLKAQYIEIFANGSYYDEVKDNLSSTDLSLRAIAETGDPTRTNVNVLTTLARQRIDYLLIIERTSFETAKKIAQKEVLEAFDIQFNDLINFNELDITKEGDDNAVLLAASLVVQGNMSVAEVSELISQIALDLKEDGKLNDQSIKDKLRENASGLDLNSIRANLEKRYKELSYQAAIPEFEKYAKRLVPLRVLRSYPNYNDSFVPHNLSEIILKFNKALDPNSINSENIQIINNGGIPLKGQWEYDDQNFTVKFKLEQEMAHKMSYQIIVGGQTKALDGKGMTGGFFTTFNVLKVDLEHGLKAYYTFDGNFTDQTGKVADAKGFNIGFSSGKTAENGNQAAKFSGEGSYMTMPNIINPTQLNWSYSIWVRMDEVDDITGPFLLGSNRSGGYTADVPLYFKPSEKRFISYNGNFLVAENEMTPTEWYHLLITIENGRQKMYINGELAVDGKYYRSDNEADDRYYPGFNGQDVGLYNYYDGELYICAERQVRSSWRPFLTGAIDNVRFYDRALNVLEVAEVYNQEK